MKKETIYMKKKLILNQTLIRSKRVYTPSELAVLLNCCVDTIRNWIKQGLKVLEGTSMPYLIRGSDAIEFITAKKKKRKVPLNPGEFFCTRCNKSRKSDPKLIKPRITGKIIGNARQIIIEGICIECGCRMYYFTTDKHILKLIEEGMPVREGTYIIDVN